MDAAVDAANRAFAKWRLVPAPRRAEIMFRAAEMLLERKEEYSRDMTREMGKILKETRGDTQEAIDTAYYFAGEGRRMFGPTTPSELPNKFAMAVRHPHRRLRHDHAVEFPHGDSIVEAAARHRLRQHLRDQAGAGHAAFHFQPGAHAVRCRRPQRRDQHCHRIRSEVGAPLMEHPDVRAISLTGSTEVGRIVGTTAAKSFKHCSLELGGKNPMIVLDDANLDLAIEGGLWGGFGTTGQRCTATSRIIVQKGVYAEFVERYVDRAKAPEGRQRSG